MAGLKISELSSSLAPSLSGVTPVVLNNTTFKTSLQTLREVLVDSGSHIFSGPQTINGELMINNSSIFGNSLNNIHQFTGSVMVTGSVNATEMFAKNSLYVSGFTVIGDPIHHTGSDPEALHVGTTDSYNIAHFKGDNPYYTQVYIKNLNSGSNASTDLVVVADNGTENVHFVDLGINSSTYSGGLVGRENDAYLLNVGKDLYIGTVGGTQHPAKLFLFAENNWENPQITIHTGSQVTFNTNQFTEGYSYEFSGSIKLQNELSVNGSITASYFVGDGSQLTNLPGGGGNIDTSSFLTTGSNVFVGDQTITGSVIFGNGGIVQSISSSSGDGNGYSTMVLNPDTTLGSDQYVILDPTSPNHIHIRAGGAIDNSGAELILGGEKNHISVNDSNPSVRMQTESEIFLNSYYFQPGQGVSSIEWYSENGNNYVRFNDPTMDVYNAIWAFNYPSTFNASYNQGNDYVTFTINGSGTPGFPQPPVFYVLEAPPTSPTYLDYADIQIKQNRQTYIEANGSDVRIQAADDVRIYSNDIFRLINYSSNEPIEIILNYDISDKTFAFNPDGSLGFPDGSTQNTAFTTSSLATTGSNLFVGDQTIDGFTILSSVTSSFNNDSEAEAGGVPLQGLYRSGSFVMIRLT